MKTKEVIKILEENKLTNIQKKEGKVIHTKTFYCDGSQDDYEQHPRVYYTFDNKVDSTDKTDKGYVVCEYCYAEFIYKEKDFYEKVQEEKDLLDMSMKESTRQKEERTYSEEMQDKIEPIDDSYVNKILKGSG